MQEETCCQTLTVWMSLHPVVQKNVFKKHFGNGKESNSSEKVRQMRKEEVSEHSEFKQ